MFSLVWRAHWVLGVPGLRESRDVCVGFQRCWSWGLGSCLLTLSGIN